MKPTESFWYLATPYSRYPVKGFLGLLCRLPFLKHLRLWLAFIAASRQAALLVAAGVKVFSPIAHTHPIAVFSRMDPFSHGIWIPADEPFMDAAYGLIVCMLPGWVQSRGIDIEIKRFRRAGKRVHFMRPGQVPGGLVS